MGNSLGDIGMTSLLLAALVEPLLFMFGADSDICSCNPYADLRREKKPASVPFVPDKGLVWLPSRDLLSIPR